MTQAIPEDAGHVEVDADSLVGRFAAGLARADGPALLPLLAPEVSFARLGLHQHGIDAVVTALCGIDLYRRVDWQVPGRIEDGIRLVGIARDPVRDPGLVLTLGLSGGRIVRIAQQRIPPSPPEPSLMVLPDTLRALIDRALEERCPMIFACSDPQGQPVLSFRGSVQVLGDDCLSMWVRNRGGRLMDAIRRNPRVALMYRNEETKATYQLQGRAYPVDDAQLADRIYERAPRVEREHDFARLGVAVVIDLDRVEGYAGLGPTGQSGRLLLSRSNPGAPKRGSAPVSPPAA